MCFPPRPCCSIRARNRLSAAASCSVRPLVRNASNQYTSKPSRRRPRTYCKYTQKCPPLSGKAATLCAAMTIVGMVFLSGHLHCHGQHGPELLEPFLDFGQRLVSPFGVILHQSDGRPDDPVGEAGVLVRLENIIQ